LSNYEGRGWKSKSTSISGAAVDVEDFRPVGLGLPLLPPLELPTVSEVTGFLGDTIFSDEQRRQILTFSALSGISELIDQDESEEKQPITQDPPKKSGLKDRMFRRISDVTIGKGMELVETETVIKTPLGQITKKYRKKSANFRDL